MAAEEPYWHMAAYRMDGLIELFLNLMAASVRPLYKWIVTEVDNFLPQIEAIAASRIDLRT